MSITKIIAKKVTDYNNPRSIGSRLRAKRLSPLIKMIDDIESKNGKVKIIDIGGTEKYWNIFTTQYLKEKNVDIVIVNLPGAFMPDDHWPFKFIEADGCNLSSFFKDKSFDIAHSNSVIEHVGDWNRMIQFTNEFSRLAEKYFIQTPNYWFPIEPHCMTPFFYWLPKPIRIWLVFHFQLGHWQKASSFNDAILTVESARLLTKKMLQSLFPGAHILTEKFIGIPKSFIVLKG